jgi:hypothetical protein
MITFSQSKKPNKKYSLARKILRALTMGTLISAASARGETLQCPKEAAFVFQKGDTLSDVLWAVGKSRIYGPRGRIAKIVTAHSKKFSKKHYGHIRVSTTLPITVEACPDSTLWAFENGFLVKKRNAHHESPASIAMPVLQPTPDPTPAYSIVEPTQETIPAPKELKGEVNNDSISAFINN